MTDLTDRMRTCAAFIMNRPHDAPMPTEHLLDDTAALLIEAADKLDGLVVPLPLGEPMEIMKPWVENPLSPLKQKVAPPTMPPGVWIDESLGTLPGGPRPRNACPKCDSRAGKTVLRRDAKHIDLECPVCGHHWGY